ncbi:MAG: thiamine-phosphate kinase [Xanthomonadales bacterium]|nr:thiamine-phosphate kinase [Xanthomonadales bacterium]
MAEFELIEILKRRCKPSRADVRLGIGDDAAVVAVAAEHELVICTDTLVAGVHFPLDTDPADIGWKALAVNLSDLAAMGAQPVWALLALTLPSADADFITRFADGFADLAAQYQIDLIGGDTTSGPLTITVTAHGLVPTGQALRRDAARVGDVVFVTGTLGDAAAGLRCLQSNDADRPPIDVACAMLISRLNRPQPRVAAGLALRGLANACIDVSDGLLADLGHIAEASGAGIEIGEDCLPGSTALFERFDADACHALQMTGGDDYELAFTIAESNIEAMQAAMTRAACRVSRIGRVIAEAGVHVLDRNGERKQVHGKGWEHFA